MSGGEAKQTQLTEAIETNFISPFGHLTMMHACFKTCVSSIEVKMKVPATGNSAWVASVTLSARSCVLTAPNTNTKLTSPLALVGSRTALPGK